MSFNVEKISSNQVKITVVVEKEDFNKYYESEFEKVLSTVEIKGFRKGKVPRNIYMSRFGDGQVIQNAVDKALSNTYFQVVNNERIQTLDDPEIDIDFEKLSKEKVLEYTAVVTVYPEVELGEYFGVEVERQSTEVTEEDLNAHIERDLKGKGNLELVEDGAIEKGDTAVFDFEGFVDGVAFEGGKSENYSLEIGSGQFIPGFEDQMVGLKSGEEASIKVTFPEDYQAEHLAGKEAEFKIKVHEIKKLVLPELNDEFVASLEMENVKTVEEYKNHLNEHIKEEKQEASDNAFEFDVVDQVCKNAKVDIPEVLVNRRLDSIIEQEEQRVKGYGISFEQLLQYQGMSLEIYKEQMKKVAENDVLREVVLNKVMEVEKLELSDEDIEKGYENLAKAYNQEVATVKEQLPLDRVTYHFLLQKTVNLLKEKAVVKA
ncbi:MAG: trigger factor [Bacilli bacterium]